MAMITMVLFAVISVISGFAWSIVALIAIRFALGVAISTGTPTGAAFVAEFMPLRDRPRMLFARLLSFRARRCGGRRAHRAVVGAHAQSRRVASAVRHRRRRRAAHPLLARAATGGPRWLYNDGKPEQAREVLERLFKEAGGTGNEEPPALPALPVSALFGKRFIGRTIFATVPWFCMDVALYGMALFTPIILASSGFGDAKNTFWSRDIHALRGALWLDVILVVGFIVGIALVNRAGVLRLQIWGFAGMVAGLLLVVLGTAQNQGALIFAGFAIFNLSVNAGPNGTTYIIAAVEFRPPCGPPGAAWRRPREDRGLGRHLFNAGHAGRMGPHPYDLCRLRGRHDGFRGLHPAPGPVLCKRAAGAAWGIGVDREPARLIYFRGHSALLAGAFTT